METELHFFSHPKSFVLKIQPRTVPHPLIFTMILEWQDLCPVVYRSQETQLGDLWCPEKQEVGGNDEAPLRTRSEGADLAK